MKCNMEVEEGCQKCARWKNSNTPFMKLYGPTPCDILFIGEAPGKQEDKVGRPFWPTAPAGKKLHDVIRQVGLHKYRLAYTNAVRCWAPDPQNYKRQNKTPTKDEIKYCNGFLREDIERADPKLIVVLGAIALRGALNKSNITRKHGEKLRIAGRTYLPVYHPSYVVRDPRYEQDFVRDMMQARHLIEQALGQADVIARLKKRYRTIGTMAELDAMIAEAMTQPTLGFDTEFYPLDLIEKPRICYGVTISWTKDDGTVASYFIPIDHPQSPFKDNLAVKLKIRALLLAKPLDTHNAEADVETAAACFFLHPRDIKIAFDSMAGALVLHGPTASAGLKTLTLSEAPDIAGYDEELEKFKVDSNKHRATLFRLDWIKAEMKKLERRRDVQLAKHPNRTPKPYKKMTELSAELGDLEEAHREAIAFIKKHGTIYDGEDYGTIPLPILANPYGCGDGESTVRIKGNFVPKIVETEQEKFFYKALNRAWRLNLAMRYSGLLIDWDEWNKRWEYYTRECAKFIDQIRALSDVAPVVAEVEKNGKDFSFHPSSNDLPSLLFVNLELPEASYKTDTGRRAMDRQALLEIRAQNDHPILDLLIEKSKVDTKLRYIESYVSERDNQGRRILYPDGRVHSRFHQFTESTRRGASAINSQNVTAGDPLNLAFKKMEKGDRPDNLRMIFRAPPGFSFVSFDYKALEFRLAASYSKDPGMIAAIKSGDPHQVMAEWIGIIREAAKVANFLLIYGGSAARLQASLKEDAGLDFTLEKCQEIRDAVFERYSELDKWIKETHEFIRENGYVRTAMGQIRFLPHAQYGKSDDPYVAERALREGLNHTCQALGHTMLQLALDELLTLIWENGLAWDIVNEQHDSGTLCVPNDQLVEAITIGQHIFESVPRRELGSWLLVDLPVEPAVGSHLGNLKTCVNKEGALLHDIIDAAIGHKQAA